MLNFLKSHQLDHLFTKDTIAHLEIHDYNSNDVLYYVDDNINHLSIIISGSLKVISTSIDGKDALIDDLKSNEILGDIEYFNHQKSIHTVIASSKTKILSIPYEIINNELTNHVPFLQYLCFHLSSKLSKSSIIHSNQLLMPAKIQICSYILNQYDQNEKMIILINYTKLALLIGKSDRHIRRIITNLVDEKIIIKNRGSIEIINLKKLQEICR